MLEKTAQPSSSSCLAEQEFTTVENAISYLHDLGLNTQNIEQHSFGTFFRDRPEFALVYETGGKFKFTANGIRLIEERLASLANASFAVQDTDTEPKEDFPNPCFAIQNNMLTLLTM